MYKKKAPYCTSSSTDNISGISLNWKSMTCFTLTLVPDQFSFHYQQWLLLDLLLDSFVFYHIDKSGHGINVSCDAIISCCWPFKLVFYTLLSFSTIVTILRSWVIFSKICVKSQNSHHVECISLKSIRKRQKIC